MRKATVTFLRTGTAAALDVESQIAAKDDSWLSESSSRLNAVGPELAAAVLLGIISFLLSRVRTRKK